MSKETISKSDALTNLTLGKNVAYADSYSPALLQGVPRHLSRAEIGLNEQELPFTGVDIWNGYELSWLNEKGKPQVAIMRCDVPITSPNLIESKSFKLYLNSFNQHVFSSIGAVEDCLTADLSACAGAGVKVRVLSPQQFSDVTMAELSGTLLDDLDIEVNDYDLATHYLGLQEGGATFIEEVLTSNLLKSNCLITNQPDWASVQIHYSGAAICHVGLLKYLISFRMHNEFHEQCVERIFCDIMQRCQPRKLTVYARYTRRGGLDINPMRTNCDYSPDNRRNARQ